MEDRRPFDVAMPGILLHVDKDGAHTHDMVWAYDKDNPAAVELVFVPEMISRIFDRNLLHTAAIDGVPVGPEAGDVVIQPRFTAQYGHHLVITLRGPDSESGEELEEDFVLERRAAQKFLYQTYDLVPLGEEDYSVALDAFLHVMQLRGGK